MLPFSSQRFLLNPEITENKNDLPNYLTHSDLKEKTSLNESTATSRATRIFRRRQFSKQESPVFIQSVIHIVHVSGRFKVEDARFQNHRGEQNCRIGWPASCEPFSEQMDGLSWN
jgi:hypothetical protein